MESDKNKEFLFWKVFRNVYIFKIIKSYLKIKTNSFRFRVYSYDEINSVEWMIRNNYYSLLRDKVINGDPNLSFVLKTCSIPNDNKDLFFFSKKLNYLDIDNDGIDFLNKHTSSYNDILTTTKNSSKHLKMLNLERAFKYSLFNNDNNNKEFINDKQFYKSLFKNYYNYFLSPEQLQPQQTSPTPIPTPVPIPIPINGIIYKLIVYYDNDIALDIIINEYKLLKLSTVNDYQSLIILAINNHSFKVTNYLYKSIIENQIKINFNHSIIWKSIFPIYKNNGILNLFFRNNNNNKDDNLIIYKSTKVDPIIKFLILNNNNNNNNILEFKLTIKSVPKEVELLNYRIDYLVYQVTVETLLNSCYSISILNISPEIWKLNKLNLDRVSFGSSDSIIDKLLQEDYQILSIDQLNQFKSTLINLNILSTTISDLDYNDNNNNNSVEFIISKLIKMITYFSVDKNTINNHLFYSIMYYDHNKDDDGDSNNNNNNSSSGDNLKIIKKRNFFKLITGIEERTLLFKYCKGKRELQIQFLNYFLEGLGKTVLLSTFKLFIELDVHLELMDIITRELKLKLFNNIPTQPLPPHNLTQYSSMTYQQPKQQQQQQHIKTPLVFETPNSIRMFDYLYNNDDLSMYRFEISEILFKNNLSINTTSPYDFKINENEDENKNENENRNEKLITILNHFKINYTLDYESQLERIKNEVTSPTLKQSSINFIFNNFNDFKEIIISIFNNNNNNNNNNINSIEILNNINKLKYFCNGLIDCSIIQLLPLYNYLDNSSNRIEVENDYVLVEICKRGDLNGLEQILIRKNKFIIRRVLSCSIFFGQLKMFEYINNSKHSWIFSPLSNTTFPLSLYDFDQFTKYAIKYCQHSFIDYFRDVLKLKLKLLYNNNNKSFI
ncbi:hypothetical protein ACTFIR_002588 [Dictyostelium discoideum]